MNSLASCRDRDRWTGELACVVSWRNCRVVAQRRRSSGSSAARGGAGRHSPWPAGDEMSPSTTRSTLRRRRQRPSRPGAVAHGGRGDIQAPSGPGGHGRRAAAGALRRRRARVLPPSGQSGLGGRRRPQPRVVRVECRRQRAGQGGAPPAGRRIHRWRRLANWNN